MTVDFGLVRNEEGRLAPKLVELQAFPSIFGYQDVLCEEYLRRSTASAARSTGAWAASPAKATGTCSAAPSSAITTLKTSSSPRSNRSARKRSATSTSTKTSLGIHTVDIATLRRKRNKLFYQRHGKWIPIERIYNRAIVDEIQKQIHPAPLRLSRRPRRRVGRPSQLVLPHQQVLAPLSRPSLRPHACLPGRLVRRQAQPPAPKIAASSCSSRSTPSPARESSSNPPTLTSRAIPKTDRSATTTCSRSASTSSPSSRPRTAKPRPRSASCMSGPTASQR